jgi:hypothetical protein
MMPRRDFRNPVVQQPLADAANAIEFGGLDDDPYMDVAVTEGSEIVVVHGWGRKEQVTPESRVEIVKVGASLNGLAVGEFAWDRQGRSEIAVLSDDGVVHIVQNSKLDTRPFSEAEAAQRTRGNLKVNRVTENVDVESVPSWKPGKGAGWSEGAKFAAGNNVSAKSLLRANLSYRETDDLMLTGQNQAKLEILHPSGSDKALDQFSATSESTTTTLDTESAPVAVLTLPRKLNGVTDVVMLNPRALR